VRALPIKPNHKAIAAYHASLAEFTKVGVKHETAVRAAFQALLEACTSLVNKGREDKWKLVPEFSLKTKTGAKITPDGVLLDTFRLVHGVWEAKDTSDDLDKEIRAKFKLGYPRTNTLFQSPDRAILVQDGEKVLDHDISKSIGLVEILKAFFDYQPPEFDQWEKAVAEFKERLPEIGKALTDIIRREEKKNTKFAEAFEQFVTLCRQSLNPNLRKEAVEEMLVQHLLTERIFRRIFGSPDFMQRNNIASEIEKVVAALTSRSFSRDSFLGELNRFYKAIEDAAATIPDFFEKQKFLNTTYENFFQGFAVARADTLGTVYTPQDVVDFMLASVEEVLQREFGRGLGDRNVHIIDPFVGTGNFIVNLMRRLPKTQLEYKYREELHCNEVMLLPYYVATMNIEHTFLEQIGRYEAFPGICLVDTFETAEKTQAEFGFFNAENTERVKRQKAAPIFVVLGNPPYNAHQINENDNNKNRKYETVDERVRLTYVADSKAKLRSRLSDPYVKAFRWASDRLQSDGIVAFVTNNSYVDERSFDGMRKHLAKDFTDIYVVDLKGNVRKDSMREGIPIGEEHTVFGLGAMVGISIALLVRNHKKQACSIHYAEVDWKAKRSAKFALLNSAKHVSGIDWKIITPDANHLWLSEGMAAEFGAFTPVGDKLAGKALFKTYSLGVSTNRDAVAYSFQPRELDNGVASFCTMFNSEIARYHAKGSPKDIDGFVDYKRLKWSRNLKRQLKRGNKLKFDRANKRIALYRPFTKRFLYAAAGVVDEPGQMLDFFPNQETESENRMICVSDVGMRAPFSVIAANHIVDLHLAASTDAFQCFPFYVYDREDGTRHENIPLSAVVRFRQQYDDKSITNWDIFYYVYAMLHHPGYRARYAANLRRALPRILFIGKEAKSFSALAEIGRKLTDLHVNFEDAAEYKLKRVEDRDEKLNWRVETMRLTKDKRALIYNEFLTLDGIPSEAFAYRLGTRSALDWIIDQYKVSTDKRSGVTNDPNREDEPDYIVKLIGKVITVSLETQKLVEALPTLQS
jgi:predicted helicase